MSAAAMLCWSVIACSGPGTSEQVHRVVPPGPTRSDSAGVEIVLNVGPQWTAAQGWRVDSLPLAEIGSGAGVRDVLAKVDHAVRLRNGLIVILDRGVNAAELMAFTSAGAPAGTWARTGQGPFDLRGASSMLIAHGGGVAVRMTMDRWVAFDENGNPLAEAVSKSEHPRGFVARPGPLPAGVTLEDIWSGKVAPPPPSPEGLARSAEIMAGFDVIIGPLADSTWLATVRKATLDSLGRSGEIVVRVSRTRVVVDSVASLFVSPSQRTRRGTGHHGLLHPAGDRIYYGNSRESQLRIYSIAGTLLRIVRRNGNESPSLAIPAPATHDSSQRGEGAESASLPSFQTFLVDGQCNIWVQEYTQPEQPLSRNWTVFDTTGAMLGVVKLPGNVDRVFQIGSDYLLARATDDLDVPSVLLLRLVKTGQDGASRREPCFPPWRD